MRRFDVCDGGKISALFLKEHACPSIPDGENVDVQHTSVRSDCVQHNEKVCNEK